MSVYYVVETGVVATVVALSTLSLTGHYAPVIRARTMTRVVGWCDRPSRLGWIRVLGQHLSAPGASPSCYSDSLSSSAYGSGCSGCVPGESASAAPVEQPAHFMWRK